jgi:hypothetical protein
MPFWEHCKLEDGTTISEKSVKSGGPSVPIHVKGIAKCSRFIRPNFLTKVNRIGNLLAQLGSRALFDQKGGQGLCPKMLTCTGLPESFTSA